MVNMLLLNKASPEAMDLPRGGVQIRLKLHLPLPKTSQLVLTRNVLSQQLQLIHSQLGNLFLELVQLTCNNISLQGDHCDWP